MNILTIDTLEWAKRLPAAGVSQDQAEERADLSLVKGRPGVLIAIAVANFAKQFV
jgi:hypothetical protein